jgi:response regulator RpfG family c-di-GMP phosphodiesterase
LQKVRTLYPDVVRVILSSLSHSSAILKAIANGETHRYLIKPWDAELGLIPMIREALAYHSVLVEKKQLLFTIAEQNRTLKKQNQEIQMFKNLAENTEQKKTTAYANLVVETIQFLEEWQALTLQHAGFTTEQSRQWQERSEDLLVRLRKIKVLAAI